MKQSAIIPTRKACPYCESADRLTVSDVCPDNHVLCQNCIKIIDIDDLVCAECNGEGVCDYGRGEDVKTTPCQVCYPYGYDDSDARRDD